MVDSIRARSGFSREVDSLLISIIKELRWVDGRDFISRTKKRLPAGAGLLVAFYYYAAHEKHPSFISEYDL